MDLNLRKDAIGVIQRVLVLSVWAQGINSQTLSSVENTPEQQRREYSPTFLQL